MVQASSIRLAGRAGCLLFPAGGRARSQKAGGSDRPGPAARGSGVRAAYRVAFDLAVAEGCTQTPSRPPAPILPETGEHENYALAASIVLIMQAERGEFDKSLADLKEFLESRAAS